MEIKKATEAVTGGMATAAQLETINAMAKAKLTAEQIYVFSLRLCLSLDLGAEETVLRGIVEKAGAADLQKLKAALSERMRLLQPVVTQLPRTGQERQPLESGFLI